PKRSDQRVRRNKDVVDVDTIEVIGEVEIPDLGLADPHPLVVDLYESLKDSGQARYYEPSDWEYARLTCHFLDQQVKAARPSGELSAVYHSFMNDLLCSHGASRSVHTENERGQTQAQVVDSSSMLC